MLEFLNGIKAYLYAGVAAIVLALGVTVYVQHTKIEAKNDRIKAIGTELSVSNQSITDLTASLKSVRDQLTAKEREEQRVQAEIAANLRRIQEQDRSLEALETRLRQRPSTSTCPIPEDLKDAWHNL